MKELSLSLTGSLMINQLTLSVYMSTLAMQNKQKQCNKNQDDIIILMSNHVSL